MLQVRDISTPPSPGCVNVKESAFTVAAVSGRVGGYKKIKGNNVTHHSRLI
jgi:hypothetical protein